MSSVHYFQRYSQPENVVTNNTLLLLSRLYNESPFKFKLLLNELADELDLGVGVNFSQQEKAANSIPDGFISQESFRIAIETKLADNFSVNQLANHLNSFGNESTKVLLALGPIEINFEQLKRILSKVKEFNTVKSFKVVFISVTFKEIVAIFRDIIDDYDFELNAIIDDYEDFCINSGLIRKDEYRMLTVACGYTLEDNFKNNLYYDPANRGYSYCSHLGIYDNKSVRGIGKIDNVITANLDENNELKIIATSNGNATQKQIDDIKNMMRDAQENIGWDIRQNNKFFCVKKFVRTNFRKTSKRGLFGKKYFNLNEWLDKSEFESTEEIAELLKLETW
ncbi:hypothetical protein [Aquimarina algiphila]|uniref:hypothetical protein n=1 Tax=Aquimarina algiphila TaxID=2047982 RepID=UPI00232C5C8F|nr:hypothetical protein [Aquimarina algiphila]